MDMNTTTGSGKGKKITLWVLGAIIVLALGGLGGYAFGQMNKQHDIDMAKQEATDKAKKNSNEQSSNSSDTTTKVTPKTVTETTCNADELSLAVQPGSGSGAGTIAYNLVLTNTGSRTCTLGGFPGVSLVNANGNQIGDAAVRADNYTEKKLTLQAGTKVYAVASVENSTNFSDGQCKAGATKFRVYPPNDTGYLSVATTLDTWCPGFMISPVLSM